MNDRSRLFAFHGLRTRACAATLQATVLCAVLATLAPTARAQDAFVVPPGVAFLRDPREAPLPVRVCPTATAAACANEYFEWADAELNRVYTAARRRLVSLRLPPEYETNLVQAQRSWIRFRDAHCQFAGEYASPGTGRDSFAALACMEIETIRRTHYLRDFAR